MIARLLLTLREIDQIGDPDERRRCMLDRFEATKELARTRSYRNKRGNEVVTSDHVAMTRIDEIMLEVLGIQPAKPDTRRVPDLSVFNGGKAADRKTG
jgi:hypothetical protein